MENEAKRILWDLGETDELVGPTGKGLEPHQQDIMNGIRQPHVELVYLDLARRGGKTFVCATYCDQEARKRPCEIRFGTAYQVNLVKFIIPAFRAVLASCPEDLRPTYLESKKEYHYDNGSIIGLLGLDMNPDGLRGNAVRIYVIDEAGYVAHLERIYDTVIMPATARREYQEHEEIKIIIISTPPQEAEEHFAWNLRKMAMEEEFGFYMHRSLDDITTISDKEKARLYRAAGGKSSNKSRREYGAEWVSDAEQALCPTFDEKRHVGVKEMPKWAVPYLVADIGGVRDRSCMHLVWYDHESGKTIFQAEREHDRNTPTSVMVDDAREFVTKYGDDLAVVIDAGGQTRGDWDDLLDISHDFPEKEGFRDSLNLLRNAFANDEVLVNPECALLIKTLRTGLLTKNRKDFKYSVSLGHCDAAACAIYSLRTIDRDTDKRPREIIRSTEAKTLKQMRQQYNSENHDANSWVRNIHDDF